MHFQPIIPFEPICTDLIPQGKQWISQIKWDGVRILTYYDGTNVRLFNRQRNERTLHYPELGDIKSFCTAGSIILDGEIIALGHDGKPSFHQVMRRDGISRMDKVKQVRKSIPITYMIFDVVFVNEVWINQLTLKKRLEVLTDIIKPNDWVQLVTSYDNGQSLFETIKNHNMEGIVIKDLTSKYAINGKDRRWQKKKVIKDLIAVIGGVTYNSGIVNALLLGLYDYNGKLWYIGHVGTGKLTQQDWKSITKIVDSISIPNCPFVNIPARRKETTWVKPVLSAKINYLAWTQNKTLRQPSIQSFVNTDVKKCTFEQD